MKFQHPATTLGKQQLELLRTSSVSRDPVISEGYKWLRSRAKENYKSNVLETVDIGPYGGGRGHKEWIEDCMQVYCQTLMFLATNNNAYAKKAMEITHDWCTKCRSFKGSNAPLEMAWGGTLLARSMELLKYLFIDFHVYTLPHMGIPVKLAFDKFLDNIAVPVLTTRFNEILAWKNNWILSMIECLLQIAFYRDDTSTASKMISQFQKSVIESTETSGLNTDSRRGDCYHFCFAVSSQIQILEMCWHQKIPVSKEVVQRIADSFNIHARFLIGEHVPGLTDTCPKYWFTHCTWEVALTYYQRMNIKLEAVEKLLSRNRPETLSFNWGPGWLHYTPSQITQK
ncbi:MAG: hypothetical protein EBU90_10320 [Proteobacteria bacterium]|nr:hypothetical protein [Pseudomonadota bacterium]NBP13804.1 hypothetical protein [bacterium]